MKRAELENYEVKLLVDAISTRHGYDFTHYSPASLKRRIINFLSKSKYSHISDLVPVVLHDKKTFKELLFNISVTVTEMFRDPGVYKKLREEVLPVLKTYPFIKVWHAGCATGEEVYSLAIMLNEEGLYDRTQIYATDFNDTSLKIAKQGIYPIENIKNCIENYQKSGGNNSFADYYHAKYDSYIIHKALKKNIVFANHNLVSDSVFNEMHLILCRNVLIYFDKTLQDRVLELFADSLVDKGFLCLGTKESLKFSKVQSKFRAISEAGKIFQAH